MQHVIVDALLLQNHGRLPFAVSAGPADKVTGHLRRAATMIRFSFPQQPDSIAVCHQHRPQSRAEVTACCHSFGFDFGHQAMSELGRRRAAVFRLDMFPPSFAAHGRVKRVPLADDSRAAHDVKLPQPGNVQSIRVRYRGRR